jgi:hypothetical protein
MDSLLSLIGFFLIQSNFLCSPFVSPNPDLKLPFIWRKVVLMMADGWMGE